MAWSWLRARIQSCDRGPPMYASRDPSGEMARRPDQAVLGVIALWRGSRDGRRDRWIDPSCGNACGRRDRGTAQRRGEILDLGIRLHLELLSHEFLIDPGVLYRAGAVAGGGKSEHELLGRTG